MNLPYGMTEAELVLDPSTVARVGEGLIEPGDPVAMLRGLSPVEVDRVFDAAAFLYQRILVDGTAAELTALMGHPGTALWAAIDTAIIWERG